MMEFQLESAKGVLRTTPGTLGALLGGVSEEWVYSTEGGETWSPYDVVGHLIHADETNWLPRARNILQHGESGVFEPFDRVAMFEKSKGKSLSDLLDEFATVRHQCLKELDQLGLTEELLDKQGLHPDFGVITLRQLLSTWVVHDLDHIQQIVRTMAKQYVETVGPWRDYLSILRR